MEDHITKSIQPGKIILMCRICGQEIIINSYQSIGEIDRTATGFEEQHEHLGKRNIDCSHFKQVN